MWDLDKIRSTTFKSPSLFVCSSHPRSGFFGATSHDCPPSDLHFWSQFAGIKQSDVCQVHCCCSTQLGVVVARSSQTSHNQQRCLRGGLQLTVLGGCKIEGLVGSCVSQPCFSVRNRWTSNGGLTQVCILCGDLAFGSAEEYFVT